MSRKKTATITYRIISGELHGVQIKTPDLGVTRPPLARLRRAVCDFLQPYLIDAHYLDLFSGSGSYLFEVVSRGVGHATGVELEPQLVDAINSEARRLSVNDRLHCFCEDVYKAVVRLSGAGKRYDIIMMAPPQYKGIIDKTLALIGENPLSAQKGIIICQHDTSETKKINFQPFEIIQQRKYGNTTFTILAGNE